MNNLRTRLALVAVAFVVAGCQSDQQVLAGSQSQAIDVAVKRGQFELNCPAATGSVLSSQLAQPVVEGPLLRGPERAEYTIGVSGCNQRQTYVVLCPQDGSGGCFAADGTR
jgi:hypothetical protein